MLTPVTDPALVEAVGPSVVGGESAPPVVGVLVGGVAEVVVGGTAAEVAGAGDSALGVGLLTTGDGAGAEGAAAGGFETADELHRLRGGVVILQAPGRERARVWFMGIPREVFAEITSWQRQAALVLTTEAREVQQPCVGLVLLGPPCKKVRHGVILANGEVQDELEAGTDWAPTKPAFLPAAMTMSTSVNARTLAIVSSEINLIAASAQNPKKHRL